MFYNAVMRCIDTFANSSFVDDKISIEADYLICGFLLNAKNQAGEQFINYLDWSYQVDKGLTVTKKESYSNDNNINPALLVKLKEITGCFIRSLAINWTVIDKTENHAKIYNPCKIPWASSTVSHF